MPLIKQPHNTLKPSEFSANAISDEQQDEIDHNSQTIHNPQVPITIILLILTTYICIGTVIFSLWENWSIVDGAYFCFVTLSTIGFGNNQQFPFPYLLDNFLVKLCIYFDPFYPSNYVIFIQFSHFRRLGADQDISRSRITIVCVLLLLDIGSSAGGYVIQFTWNSIAVEVSANGSASKIGTRLIVWWGGYNRLIGFEFRCVEIICACFEFIININGKKEMFSAPYDSKNNNKKLIKTF